MDLLIENVRCFAGPHELPIAPLTILLGENSSGKSTALAMLQTIGDHSRFPAGPRLATAPYELGTFDTIVSRCRGGPSPDTFSVGYRERGPGSPGIVASYRSERNRPALSRLSLEGPHCNCVLDFVARSFSGSFGSDHQVDIREAIPKYVSEEYIRSTQGDILSLVIAVMSRTSADRSVISTTFEAVAKTVRNIPHATSMSPIRSRPKRHYDDLDDGPSPDGADVPRLLLRMMKGKTTPKEGAALKALLSSFGRESGLFSQIDVRPMGNHEGDPFQVRAKISGQPRNLTDIGYGVSQALPVVIRASLTGSNGMLLLQQPEVHLHPRAQAQLGTLFSVLVGKTGRRFVIETHSDFLVDRVRQEVATGTIRKDQIQILFFHRTGTQTEIHPIQIDDHGDVVDPPDCYRQFFLEEQYRLLTRASRQG